MYSLAGYEEVLRTTIEAQEAMERDPRIGMFTSVSPGSIVVGLFYADAKAERPQVFETFLKLGSLIQVVVPTITGTIKTLVDAIGPPSAPTRYGLNPGSVLHPC